jgi:hypothetical protein
MSDDPEHVEVLRSRVFQTIRREHDSGVAATKIAAGLERFYAEQAAHLLNDQWDTMDDFAEYAERWEAFVRAWHDKEHDAGWVACDHPICREMTSAE